MRTAPSMREKSATSAAPVKFSLMLGGLIKAIWAAPIFDDKKVSRGGLARGVRDVTYQGNNVCERTKQDGESAVQHNFLDTLINRSVHSFSPRNLTGRTRRKTYHLGHHLPIKLNVALPIPVHIQVQLDPIIRRLRDLDI